MKLEQGVAQLSFQSATELTLGKYSTTMASREIYSIFIVADWYAGNRGNLSGHPTEILKLTESVFFLANADPVSIRRRFHPLLCPFPTYGLTWVRFTKLSLCTTCQSCFPCDLRLKWLWLSPVRSSYLIQLFHQGSVEGMFWSVWMWLRCDRKGRVHQQKFPFLKRGQFRLWFVGVWITVYRLWEIDRAFCGTWLLVDTSLLYIFLTMGITFLVWGMQ